MGVIAAVLGSRLLSFNKLISEQQPSIFFVEEAKFRSEGKLKLHNYKVFELVRENNCGGGIALGVKCEKNPFWVGDGGQDVEALSILISVKAMKIRCCVAYGCQENFDLREKIVFAYMY